MFQHQKQEKRSNLIIKLNYAYLIFNFNSEPQKYTSEQYDDSTIYARKSLPQNSESVPQSQKEEFYDLYDHIHKKPEENDPGHYS